MYHKINESDSGAITAKASKTGLSAPEFVKNRAHIIGTIFGDRIKDSRKSSNAKHNWRTNRGNYMGAIKKWTKSTAGKRFHRQLGFFNQFKNKNTSWRGESLDDSVDEAIVAIMSMRTHLMIETRYAIPDYKENLAFEEFFHTADTILADAVERMHCGEGLDEDHVSLLETLVAE